MLPEVKKKRKRTKTVNDEAEELKEDEEIEVEREVPVVTPEDVESLQRIELERQEARMKQEKEDE